MSKLLDDLVLVQMGWSTEDERVILFAAHERLHKAAQNIMLKRRRDALQQEIYKLDKEQRT